MDDIAMIEAFVQGAINQEVVLLASPGLRIETSFNTIQLLAKAAGLIASAQQSTRPQTILVNHGSAYWELLNQTLAANGFVLTGESPKEDFYSYQHRPVPQGYQMQCTNAMELWRVWWGTRRASARQTIPLDLLILRRETWYPVRDIITSHGTLYIKTLGKETALHGSDLIVWLKKQRSASH